jgi:DNA-directed RNA polymerase specialized sigma24 family protein
LVTNRPDIQEHMPLVRGKCREVLRQFSGYIELDDLVQEVHIWWLNTDPATLQAYLDDPRKLRLRRSVWRAARDAAEKYRRQTGGVDPYVDVRYGPSEILQILPVAMEPNGLPDGGGVREGPRPHNNLAEGGDLLAAMLDVRRAFSELSVDDQDYLHFIRRLGWSYELAGPALDIAPDSARRRVARIGQRMADVLNGDTE